MSTKLYIVGTLAGSGGYPEHLCSTTEAPVPSTLYCGVTWRGVDAGRGISWRVSRGRVVEFTSQYTGSRCIAREVTDPALVAEVREAEGRVERARAVLKDAEAARDATLARVAARSAPAKVEP